MPVVHRVIDRNVRDIFERTPYLLIGVSGAPNAGLPRGLPDYLDHRFPERFTFGTLWRGDWPPERLGAELRSAVGVLRRGVTDGLYLLEAGLVVGHHGGQLRPASASWAADEEERAVRARVEASPAAVRLSAVERERLQQLVGYFEPILERRVREADAPSGAEPPAPTEAEPVDAYAVLGIAVSATDDEIRAAYKQALKLNHPDKVAHLSPALQQFAQQQTLKVRAAYDWIAARRGLR